MNLAGRLCAVEKISLLWKYMALKPLENIVHVPAEDIDDVDMRYAMSPSLEPVFRAGDSEWMPAEGMPFETWLVLADRLLEEPGRSERIRTDIKVAEKEILDKLKIFAAKADLKLKAKSAKKPSKKGKQRFPM